MRSNNYSLRVVNDEGTLKVRELDLTAPMFKHALVSAHRKIVEHLFQAESRFIVGQLYLSLVKEFYHHLYDALQQLFLACCKRRGHS